MYKAAILGDRDSIYGFASLGLDIFPEDDPLSAARTLRRLAEGSYAVIFITEKLASQLEAEVARYCDKVLPAIIPIPGVTGNTGLGQRAVKAFVERAVGSDIVG